MTLDKLIPGMSGKVTIVHGEGLLRRRLLEMGLTPKTAGSSTLDADLGVRVSFVASKRLAISTE